MSVVNALVEVLINFSHIGGIIGLRGWDRPIQDFESSSFEVSAPIGDLFVKFTAAGNNDFFH